MYIFHIILALSFIGFLVHFLLGKKKTFYRGVELMLLYQLVFNLGILGFLSFMGLTYMPETVAAHNNWPTCPFQQEMANVNLGFSALGILCIWIRGHFWTATVIGASIWLFADGLNHLLDMYQNKNFSEGNQGILLYSDLGLPILMLILLSFYLKIWPKRK